MCVCVCLLLCDDCFPLITSFAFRYIFASFILRIYNSFDVDYKSDDCFSLEIFASAKLEIGFRKYLVERKKKSDFFFRQQQNRIKRIYNCYITCVNERITNAIAKSHIIRPRRRRRRNKS